MSMLRWTTVIVCSLSSAIVGAPLARATPQAVEERERETAFIDVDSNFAAHIIIDGADTGKTTPQRQLPLAAGHHVLTLVTTIGARKRTIGFTVDAGRTKKLTIHFATEP